MLQKELNELISKHKIIISKKDSLYFLIEDWEIQKLIELLELKEEDSIALINSNAGFIARELGDYETTVFEPIEKIAEVIEEEFTRENLEVVKEAFAKAEVGEKFSKILSVQQLNKKTLFKLLKQEFEIAVLLVNERFAEKLLAEKGFLDYGEVSVLTQYYCNVEACGGISPGEFFPQLNAFVKIMKLEKKEPKEKAKDEELFEEFVKNLFRFKNKNIENALKNGLKAMEKEIKKEEMEKVLEVQKIAKQKVALLSVQEFVHLFNELF